MNMCVCHQGAEDRFCGNRLSEHPAVHHHIEDSFPPGSDRPSVSVPNDLWVFSGDGGIGARRAVQVLPKVHEKGERYIRLSKAFYDTRKNMGNKQGE